MNQRKLFNSSKLSHVTDNVTTTIIRISKKLKKAPIQYSSSSHFSHLCQFHALKCRSEQHNLLQTRQSSEFLWRDCSELSTREFSEIYSSEKFRLRKNFCNCWIWKVCYFIKNENRKSDILIVIFRLTPFWKWLINTKVSKLRR